MVGDRSWLMQHLRYWLLWFWSRGGELFNKLTSIEAVVRRQLLHPFVGRTSGQVWARTSRNHLVTIPCVSATTIIVHSTPFFRRGLQTVSRMG
uniref:Uncharacterized protein n=1 Tax=Anopheles triannulatus TaxID=58253 RepID=A0A2M4B698_9DIPT